MKLCRFFRRDASPSDPRVGLVDGDAIRDVTAAVAAGMPALRWPLPPGDPLMRHLDELRPRLEDASRRAEPLPRAAVHLLCPVANPHKVICGGGNYPEQVKMTGKQPKEHGLFFKAGRLVGPDDGVTLSFPERHTVHETELAVVIGKSGFRIAQQDALTHVAGYAIGLDMTLKAADGGFGPESPSYIKSPDTYGVLGPWLVTPDEIDDPQQLQIRMEVAGELRQDMSTSRMVLDVAGLIAFASEIMELHPGDVIMTGNPPGGKRVVAGDVMEASISGIGGMRVGVR